MARVRLSKTTYIPIVKIISKIRDEKKFNNLEELKNQIKKDVEECLK